MADKKSLVNIDFGGGSSIKGLPSATAASGDYIVLTDASDGGKAKKGPSFATNDGKFLRHDGTWQTPPSGGMYVHQIRIKVTSTVYLDMRITTSRSTPYSNAEQFESRVAGHMHVLYNAQANTYKPIFITDFSGEYGAFSYIDILNGSFRSPSSYSNIDYDVTSDSVWQA